MSPTTSLQTPGKCALDEESGCSSYWQYSGACEGISQEECDKDELAAEDNAACCMWVPSEPDTSTLGGLEIDIGADPERGSVDDLGLPGIAPDFDEDANTNAVANMLTMLETSREAADVSVVQATEAMTIICDSEGAACTSATTARNNAEAALNKLSAVIAEVNTSNFVMIGYEADFREIVKAMDQQIDASNIATAVVKELAAASRTKEASCATVGTDCEAAQKAMADMEEKMTNATDLVKELSKEVDAKIAKSTANVDTADPKNGPNGEGCVNGVPVDAVPLDSSFTCSCDNAHEGGNCEVEVKASGASSGDDNTGTIIAVVVVLLLLAVIVVGFLLYRRQERHMKEVISQCDSLNETGVADSFEPVMFANTITKGKRKATDPGIEATAASGLDLKVAMRAKANPDSSLTSAADKGAAGEALYEDLDAVGSVDAPLYAEATGESGESNSDTMNMASGALYYMAKAAEQPAAVPGEALYDMAVTDESQSAATGGALYDTAGIDESQPARPMYAEATAEDGSCGALDEATYSTAGQHTDQADVYAVGQNRWLSNPDSTQNDHRAVDNLYTTAGSFSGSASPSRVTSLDAPFPSAESDGPGPLDRTPSLEEALGRSRSSFLGIGLGRNTSFAETGEGTLEDADSAMYFLANGGAAQSAETPQRNTVLVRAARSTMFEEPDSAPPTIEEEEEGEVGTLRRRSVSYLDSIAQLESSGDDGMTASSAMDMNDAKATGRMTSDV